MITFIKSTNSLHDVQRPGPRRPCGWRCRTSPTRTDRARTTRSPFNRYRVVYKRTDGRNQPGVEVPYAFDGGSHLHGHAGRWKSAFRSSSSASRPRKRRRFAQLTSGGSPIDDLDARRRHLLRPGPDRPRGRGHRQHRRQFRQLGRSGPVTVAMTLDEFMRRLREPQSHHRAEAMQITHARTNDSLRRSRVRRASLLGWLPVAAALALPGCTVKKTEAPDITGPSELGLSIELRVSPDVLSDGWRLAVDADHHVAGLERQGRAERRRPRRGDGRRRDRRRRRASSTQERQDGRRRPRDADLHGAEQRVDAEQRLRQPPGRPWRRFRPATTTTTRWCATCRSG